MRSVSFEEFISLVREYNEEEVEIVTKAYLVAKRLHEGQKRQSGEDYITHPLCVAYILAQMKADRDTLCAGLLHDTLEDTNITKDDIEYLFNSNVASLVDGVSKINKLNFTSKEEEEYANTRKIITGITNDARIIIIKLADRLHNMRTLQYKTPYKQKEKSIETMEIYVPFASYLGDFKIKYELEDLSFKYLKPDIYKEISEYRNKLENNNIELLNEMIYKINTFLKDNSIPNEIKYKFKNIYSIYKKTMNGQNKDSIHDLLALKVLVDNINDCYLSLGYVHSLYKPYNQKFKDYIASPKTNMYQSLHTTVFADENRLVQTQIRTHDMDLIASYGLTAYWNINKGNAKRVMLEDLNSKFQFFKSLSNIDSLFEDNKEFVTQVKTEVFSDRVYVYNSSGDIIELPIGSNIIDYAYKLGDSMAQHLVNAYVNNNPVSFNYTLKNGDRIHLVTNELIINSFEDLCKMARTSYAKKLLR